MRRPEDLFGRESEWRELVEFASQPGSGIRLALVRGRRRQGKSFLLRRLAAGLGGFYFQAVQEQRSQALAGIGAALGRHLAVPGGQLAFTDWDAAIDALTALPRNGTPVLVVLDEFPYLVQHSPELASVLQRAIDRSGDIGPGLRLVLCGSALSAMAGLLTGNQALRGRASVDLVMRTFDYRTAASYWGITDPATALLVHAIVGGTPGYRDLLPQAPPKRLGDVARWLGSGVLNPASALFREDHYLLAEEPSLPDRALYHAVLTAVADGNGTQAKIAGALGREQRAVQYPLRALEEAGFLIRTEDALRSRRPLYSLADPIVRFHHVVTRHDLARFEDRHTHQAWSDAQPRFATHVLGPHFEQLAREFTARFASASTVGGQVASVGPAVISDPKARRQHELDVVALARRNDGSRSVLAIGEAKHTTAKRTSSDLLRLEHLRTLIASRDPAAATARLLLFSASGFERNLVNHVRHRSDVELINLARLYTGQ